MEGEESHLTVTVRKPAYGRFARQYGVKVCLDAEGVWPGMDELLELVDVLIPSERCAYALSGSSDDEFAAWYIYRKYRPEVLVITQGPKGDILFSGTQEAVLPINIENELKKSIFAAHPELKDDAQINTSLTFLIMGGFYAYLHNSRKFPADEVSTAVDAVLTQCALHTAYQAK